MKYKELDKTSYPPSIKPLLIWDGACGFCHYWILRWKNITGNEIEYERYETAAKKFPDIPKKRFKEAVRLIDTNGKIYSGAAAAYRSLNLNKKCKFLYRLYQRSCFFRKFSDGIYNIIAANRPILYYLSIWLWGKNPIKQKPYWIFYLSILLIILFLILT